MQPVRDGRTRARSGVSRSLARVTVRCSVRVAIVPDLFLPRHHLVLQSAIVGVWELLRHRHPYGADHAPAPRLDG